MNAPGAERDDGKNGHDGDADNPRRRVHEQADDDGANDDGTNGNWI